MGNLWTVLLYQPLLNGVVGFYQLFGNLGWAIVVFTVILRVILVPLTAPSMKAGQKMKELAPDLERLKKKYKDDKKALAEAQMQLYKQHGVNPAAGCLPQIVQIVVLIALYQAFNQVLRPNGGNVIEQLNRLLYAPLRFGEGTHLNLNFLYLDLARPDVFHIPGLSFPLPGLFLIGAAVAQFVSSKMMLPAVKQEEGIVKKTKETTDDAMVAAQKNMMYLFPLMTIFIGFSFPSGLVVYWLVFSVFQLGQQVWLSKGMSWGRILAGVGRREKM